MKIFFAVVAFLIVLSGSSSAVDPIAQINKDYTKISYRFPGYLNFTFNKLKTSINNQIMKYETRIGTLLAPFQSALQGLALDTLLSNFNGLILVSLTVVRYEADIIKQDLQQTALGYISNAVKKVAEKIKNKPKALSCWTKNTAALSSFFIEVSKVIYSTVGSITEQTDRNITTLLNQFETIIQQDVASIVTTCGSDTTCFDTAVSINSPMVQPIFINMLFISSNSNTSANSSRISTITLLLPKPLLKISRLVSSPLLYQE